MRILAAAVTLAATLASIGATSVAAFPATPTVWYVDDDGHAGSNGCNGSQSVPSVIQTAVDVANPGDTVMVCPGTYVGTVDVSKNDLLLTSTKPWTAVIKAPSSLISPTPVVKLHDADHIYLRWFSIVAGTTAPCATPNALVSVSNVPNARVRANHLGIDGAEGSDCRSFINGINISNSPNSFVGWNRVTDFSGVGIQLVDSLDSQVRGNTISFFHAVFSHAYSDSVGILSISADVMIRGNVVRALPTAGDSTPVLQVGINIFRDNNIVYRNRVRHANYGIQTIGTSGLQVEENQVRHGLIAGILLSNATGADVGANIARAAYEGIFVASGSTLNNIHDNDFRGPSDPDCLDQSTGGGTSNTANTWTNDLGDESSPSGICATAP